MTIIIVIGGGGGTRVGAGGVVDVGTVVIVVVVVVVVVVDVAEGTRGGGFMSGCWSEMFPYRWMYGLSPTPSPFSSTPE